VGGLKYLKGELKMGDMRNKSFKCDKDYESLMKELADVSENLRSSEWEDMVEREKGLNHAD
jgi:hypothetical protein